MDSGIGSYHEPSVVEQRLDATERRWEAWKCLMDIAAGLCIVFFCSAIWNEAAGISLLPDHFLIFSAAVILLLALLPLSVVWVISQQWTVVVLPALTAIILECLGLFYANVFQRPPLYHTLFYIGAVVVFVLVMPTAFRVLRSNSHDRAVIALAKGRTFGFASAIFAVFGIPPTWTHLNSRPRQIVGLILFIISQLVLGCMVCFLVMLPPLLLVEAAESIQRADSRFAVSYFASIPIILLLPLLVIVLAGGFRNFARRFSRTSLERMISADVRPPVLFLRSFRDDQVRLGRPKRGFLTWLLLLGEPRATLDQLLLEEATIRGPVIAIGAPGSRPPFGAARAYLTDDNWKDVVSNLARSADTIVIALDETPGVQWELNEIHVNDYTAKILYILPPVLERGRRGVQVSQGATQRLLRRGLIRTSRKVP